ncbi:MAG: hypothetical protein Q4G11_05205 [Gallicola sp.]|nr:hypothetical protein [Gallicola sp.]
MKLKGQQSRDAVLAECKKILDSYPHMKLKEKNGLAMLEGRIILEAHYNGVHLSDYYECRLVLPQEYPGELPVFYELSDKVPKEFGHKYSDCSCCLGVEADLRIRFAKNQTLEYFIKEFVYSYLYSATYFRRFGSYPFGQRSHDTQGVLEFYLEFWGVVEERTVLSLMHLALLPRYNLRPLPWSIVDDIRGVGYNIEQFRVISSPDLSKMLCRDYLNLLSYYVRRSCNTCPIKYFPKDLKKHRSKKLKEFQSI